LLERLTGSKTSNLGHCGSKVFEINYTFFLKWYYGSIEDLLVYDAIKRTKFDNLLKRLEVR